MSQNITHLMDHIVCIYGLRRIILFKDLFVLLTGIITGLIASFYLWAIMLMKVVHKSKDELGDGTLVVKMRAPNGKSRVFARNNFPSMKVSMQVLVGVVWAILSRKQRLEITQIRRGTLCNIVVGLIIVVLLSVVLFFIVRPPMYFDPGSRFFHQHLKDAANRLP